MGLGVERGSPPAGAETFVLRRVLLVHPDPTQRALVTAQLHEFGAVQVLEVGDLAEARTAARSPGARDLAVLGCDPGDPEFSSLLAELDGQGWYRVVVVMPGGGTRQIVSALLAGATGVLTAPGPAPADGAAPGTGARTWNGADEPEAGPRPPGVRYVPDLRGMPRALTHREQEILQLAANGHPNREIAEELGLSPLTIKSHLGRIGRKLGSGDRAQLVLLALRAGAIS
ncbi:helix-turn-helix transcriptional regulator [Pseudonocardia humida]|uniref:Helix-turn-helix transcriptional regulator n=1 Tax=Pseudonocardia humida TaxID=2800819 RepID=A0ABT0ZSA6_9PSEU|nr:LuxR C-terminal-related transcriptional regulator [Pseudonocardia humida]MCO1653599.1 helix-turn-helix transcriptional regulator [Pseudonocardia humida]